MVNAMFKTENTGSETYLVYTMEKGEVTDELSLGMLTNNKIPGLLPASYYMRDGERLIRYLISSKVSLESYLTGTVSRKKLLMLFKTITGAFLSSEEYMLEPHQLQLGISDIYVNVSTSEASLVCLPLVREVAAPDIRRFFKEILFSSRFETGENGDYLLELSNYLNSDGGFSPAGFHQLVSRLLNGNERRPVTPEPARQEYRSVPVQPTVRTEAEPPKTPASAVKPEKEKKSFFKKKEKIEMPPEVAPIGGKGFLIPGVENPVTMNNFQGKAKAEKKDKKEKKEKVEKEKKPLFSFGKKKEAEPAAEVKTEPAAALVRPDYKKPVATIGETTVLATPTGGETTVLGGGSSPDIDVAACLVRKKTGERITIRKQVFRLGKEPSYVDYCIKDNTAISRSHADIMRKGSSYVIVDNNSLNHTYVDGLQLAPQEQAELWDGAVILLADEAFEFKENQG